MDGNLSHADRAEALFREGYNCAQAVFAAFCDVTGTDEKTALMLSSPFGGGMGRMREVCGTVSGMFMALGLLYGYDNGDAKEKKAELYANVRALADRFRAENGGTIICRELLPKAMQGGNGEPAPRTEEFYRARPCVRYVRSAAELLDEFIKNQQAITTERMKNNEA